MPTRIPLVSSKKRKPDEEWYGCVVCVRMCQDSLPRCGRLERKAAASVKVTSSDVYFNVEWLYGTIGVVGYLCGNDILGRGFLGGHGNMNK